MRAKCRKTTVCHKKEEMIDIKVKQILRRLSIIFRCLMGLFLLRLWFHLVPVSKRKKFPVSSIDYGLKYK